LALKGIREGGEIDLKGGGKKVEETVRPAPPPNFWEGGIATKSKGRRRMKGRAVALEEQRTTGKDGVSRKKLRMDSRRCFRCWKGEEFERKA